MAEAMWIRVSPDPRMNLAAGRAFLRAGIFGVIQCTLEGQHEAWLDVQPPRESTAVLFPSTAGSGIAPATSWAFLVGGT